MTRSAHCLGICGLLAFGPAHAGALLDYLRNYDLNDYSLGVSISTSQNPYTDAPNSVVAYPYLTSFTHSAFTDDWFLIRDANIGIRYVTQSDWELAVLARVQTLGLGNTDNDELLGLEPRRWAIEAGPMVGWRRWPVNVHFTSYWELPDRHGGTTSELDFTLPMQFERGYFVPGISLIYMSDDYSNYYFGVSEQESTPSRPQYEPGAIMNVELGFTIGYELTPQWLLSTRVGLQLLDSAVTASPIVGRDKLWSASVGLAYRADLFQARDHDEGPQQQQIEIRLGALSSSIDTTVSREASGGQPGGEIDLEDVLGIPDRETIFQVDMLFRMGYYHRLELSYFELQRRSTKILQQDIVFGDETFPAGTEVDTNMESDYVRLAYSYSLMRDRQKELGVTAGVTYARFETELSADDSQQSERLKVEAPLPTMGLFGSVALGSKWRLNANINIFALDFDRYDGFMGSFILGVDRRFGDVIGAGIGYNFYTMRLDSKDENLRGTFRMLHHGPKLYVSVLF